MLSVFRLTNILKKLQFTEIANFFIIGTSECGFKISCNCSQSIGSSNIAIFSTSPDNLTTNQKGTFISNNESENCNQSINMSNRIENLGSNLPEQPKQEETSCSKSSKKCFNTSMEDIIQFLELVGSLKHIKRTGWVLRDVKDCESISGHMYRMSMMTFLLNESEGLDRTKCMELALVHDLAECLVGDITPFCGISKEEKKHREENAMEDICKLIEPRGKKIMELFTEYEESETPESKFVKDLDRLDMILQAFEYEKRDNCIKKHQEFFDSTAGKISHPFVMKLANEIYAQREKLSNQTKNDCLVIDDTTQSNNNLNQISEKEITTS